MLELSMGQSLLLSLFLLLVSIWLTKRWFLREKYSGGNLLIITGLVILSITVLRMPLYIDGGESRESSLFHGLISALQTIGLNEDISQVIEDGVCIIDQLTPRDIAVKGLSGVSWLARCYILYAVVQYLISVLLCGFSLVKTLSRMLVRLQLKMCLQPVFFFSQLTEESILLARSIQDSMKECGRHGYFCFTSVPAEMDEKLASAWTEAKLKNTFQLSDKLSCDLFPFFSSSLNCILCHPDEKTNLKELSILLRDGRDQRGVRRHMKYFVYAQSYQAEQVIDGLTAKYIPGSEKKRNHIICMLNHRENLAVHILDTVPLHECVAWDAQGQGRLNVLIAGSTPLAERFLRNAYSCGQMEECRLSITLADPEAEACRQRLLAAAPLLRQKELPIVQSCGDIHFHTLTDRAAIADEQLLRDVQYVLLAYENDNENMKAAQRIRTLIERQKLTDPDRARQDIAIVYAVEDTALNALCRELDPVQEPPGIRPCRMIPVGSLKKQHHTDQLFGDELLLRGFFLSLYYRGMKIGGEANADLPQLRREFVQFMNTAYDRRSSVSAALHIKYREYLQQTAQRPAADTAERLAHAEHLRWAAYMIMAGFLPPSDAQLAGYFYQGAATHRSLQMKLHPCIVPSTRTVSADLWAPGAVPADELDGFSLRVHSMLLERLKAYLPAELLDNPRRESKEDIVQAAAKLQDEESRRQAMRLSKSLFTDFKHYDLDIVNSNADIVRIAGDPEIKAAMRLFWLEEDKA